MPQGDLTKESVCAKCTKEIKNKNKTEEFSSLACSFWNRWNSGGFAGGEKQRNDCHGIQRWNRAGNADA